MLAGYEVKKIVQCLQARRRGLLSDYRGKDPTACNERVPDVEGDLDHMGQKRSHEKVMDRTGATVIYLVIHE